jgi:succinoglycan biosynthesis protein ExoL
MCKNILFLLSHQPNPRFIKQIDFLSNNNNVTVLYFFREYMQDLSKEYDYKVDLNLTLGSVSNGNYFNRIFQYLKTYMKLRHSLNNSYDILIVNNIDTLVFFKIGKLFSRCNVKVIIEISDLRSHAYLNNFKSKIIRIAESYVFKYVHGLIVTSPKFYDMYYKDIFKGECFLLENKPLSYLMPKKKQKTKNKKIVIGIVGLLLQGGPYQTLMEVLKGSSKYEVHVYGKGVYQDLVEKYSNSYDNIKFYGGYNFFSDIANIYASLDILYMPYDTTVESLNNRIALPNKLYEAMYYNIPIITSKNTYLGELIDEYEIGISIECCNNNELIRVLNNFNFAYFCKKLSELDSDAIIADNDYIKLGKYINTVAHG